ncbi:uncharacterized protein [Maniola hyperantus]|uniref:uncharacterized protein n=1 Tax=Aphantopus hyperantus TaxID=2795564 RepID=UPI003747CC8D
MDQSLLVMLHSMKTKLQNLSTNSSQIIETLDDPTTQSPTIIQEAEIISLKLQTLLNRLSSELTNYFRLSNDPAPDDISEISTVQLEAEDILCELKVKIKEKIKVIERENQVNRDTNPNPIYEMKIEMSTKSIEEIRKCLEVIITAREDAERVIQGKSEDNYTTQSLHANASDDNNMKLKSKGPTSKEMSTKKQDKNRGLFQGRQGSFRKQFKRKWEEPVGNQERQHEKKRKLHCIFCQENHFNDQCKAFTTLRERKNKLINRCYACLRIGHTVKICERKIKCAHCNEIGSHNRALCPKNLQKESETTNK